VRHAVDDGTSHALLRSWSGSSHIFVPDLSFNQAARALAGTAIRSRALAANGKPAAMAYATVTTEIHQPLDVHADFAPQIALDLELADLGAQRIELAFGQVLDLVGRIDAGRGADRPGAGPADTVDRGQGDDRVFAIGNV